MNSTKSNWRRRRKRPTHLVAPKDYAGNHKAQVKDASAKVPELLREVLNEVKATGRGDNKNVLIELNIENTRHQEIQLIGNGTGVSLVVVTVHCRCMSKSCFQFDHH